MTNEEAIQRLDEIRCENPLILSMDVAALDLAIAALKRDRWIPCEERLPEENGRYLVAEKRDLVYTDLECHDYETQVRRYFTDYGWRYPVVLTDGIREAEQRLITHWRHLPEPPKEET